MSEAEAWPDETVEGSVALAGSLPGGTRVSIRWHYLEDYPAYREEVRVHDEHGTVSLTFPSPYLLHAPTVLTVDDLDGRRRAFERLPLDSRGVRAEWLAFARFLRVSTPPRAGIAEGRADIVACQQAAARLAGASRLMSAARSRRRQAGLARRPRTEERRKGDVVKVKLFVAVAAALVAIPAAYARPTATTGAQRPGRHAAGTTIVVYASGDVNVQNLWQNNIIPHFEKANKGIYVKFIFSEHGTQDGTILARIGAAVKGRHWPGIDLVDGGLVTTLALAGLDQPVSKATAPNLKRVSKRRCSRRSRVRRSRTAARRSCSRTTRTTSRRPPKTLAGAARLDQGEPRQVHVQLAELGRLGLLVRGDGGRQHSSASAIQNQMVNGYVPEPRVELEAGARLRCTA